MSWLSQAWRGGPGKVIRGLNPISAIGTHLLGGSNPRDAVKQQAGDMGYTSKGAGAILAGMYGMGMVPGTGNAALGPAMQGIAAPPPPDASVPNVQPKGQGSPIGGVADYFTDPDRGMLRQMLLMNGIGTAGEIYSANKVGAIEDEDRKRKERTRKAVGPMYGQLLRELGQQ
jgi:hypothetical protein